VVNAPAVLPPVKIPGTHCTGDWDGPTAGLDGCGISLPPPGFDSRTVKLRASRYTDDDIPAHGEQRGDVTFIRTYFTSNN